MIESRELTTAPYHLAGYWEYQGVKSYDVVDSVLNCKAVDANALALAAGVTVDHKEAISDFVNSPKGKTFVDSMVVIKMPHEQGVTKK